MCVCFLGNFGLVLFVLFLGFCVCVFYKKCVCVFFVVEFVTILVFSCVFVFILGLLYYTDDVSDDGKCIFHQGSQCKSLSIAIVQYLLHME